ncbi:37014_t:CDS:1, partial [Racocetra persica]
MYNIQPPFSTMRWTPFRNSEEYNKNDEIRAIDYLQFTKVIDYDPIFERQ